MPTGKNWFHFIYINLGFLFFLSGIYFFTSVKTIKDNWPNYRCNPMYMPLSNDIEKDFMYCVQNIQTNYVGYLLQPLTYITSSVGNLSSSLTTDINNIRNMFNSVRNFFSTIIQDVFGVFLNMIIEFQKIIIGIRDMVAKLVGVLTAYLYILNGSIMTMQSTWNGPPGQMIQALGGVANAL